LQSLVRIGTVSSVDPGERTARVIFKDRDSLVSGKLKVLQNQPLITVEKWVTEEGVENKWDYTAHYASADRKPMLAFVFVRPLLPLNVAKPLEVLL
jgi:hypothetical protein